MNPPDEDRRVLGRTITAPITHLDHFPAPDNVTTVTITCNEVAALCPVTGQPDLYTVVVDYTPYGHVIESKALKLFLWGYRDRRISCEDLAAELVSELYAQHPDPDSAFYITVTQQSRGGIVLRATAEAGVTQ